MNLSDVIRDLQNWERQLGPGAKFSLFDLTNDREIVLDPDNEDYGFQICRGDNEVVIEFY